MRKLLLAMLTLVAVLLGILAYAYSLPQQVTFQRRLEMNAPPPQVYDAIDSAEERAVWQPQEFASAEQEVTVEQPGKRVICEVRLDEMGPPVTSELVIIPYGVGSHVEWRIAVDYGNNPFARLWGRNLERRLAPGLVGGLNRLRDHVEE